MKALPGDAREKFFSRAAKFLVGYAFDATQDYRHWVPSGAWDRCRSRAWVRTFRMMRDLP